MTLTRSALFTSAFILGVTSCAPPAQEAFVPAKNEFTPSATHAKKEATTKAPIRLNGRGKVSSISLADAFALQQAEKALIYDARPAFFYNLGHIQGAISLPKSNCDANIVKREAEIKSALAANKTIVIYCTNYTCPDARTVAIHFSNFGYPSSTLSGGWDEWKESELPTE